jgi:succinyl-CoA synthetase beta subunit
VLTRPRDGVPVAVAEAARLAARAGELLLQRDLELLELNPVRVHPRGAVAVDALARTVTHPHHEEPDRP